jgi:hypothetical protein
VHSRRMELIQRSAKAFIRGACGAVSRIWMPMEVKTASKAVVYLLSRSRISYFTVVAPVSWRSMMRFLASWVVQAAVW